MDKIYVVECHVDYDSGYTAAVFADKDTAEGYAEVQDQNDYYTGYHYYVIEMTLCTSIDQARELYG